jgi:hypothetical protein
MILIIGPCFRIGPPGLLALLMALLRHLFGRPAKPLRTPPRRHERAALSGHVSSPPPERSTTNG